MALASAAANPEVPQVSPPRSAPGTGRAIIRRESLRRGMFGRTVIAGPGLRRPGDLSPGLVITGAVLLLALPSAVLAFSNRLDISVVGAGHSLDSFASGSLDQGLAAALSARPAGKGPIFRFTPAGLATRPDRSVTVAVRVDQETARAIMVHTPARPSAPSVPLGLSAYNLGVSRGYKSFGGFGLASDNSKQEIPDISAIASADNGAGAGSGTAASRLATHIQLGEHERAGRAPRTLESVGEQSVDVGGSYRLTRNIDVTAGVRYSQDRDRLPLPAETKTDNQAVYVGTQFKF